MKDIFPDPEVESILAGLLDGTISPDSLPIIRLCSCPNCIESMKSEDSWVFRSVAEVKGEEEARKIIAEFLAKVGQEKAAP